MGIWNWHKEDKIHKNVLKIYDTRVNMMKAFRTDMVLFNAIDDTRYVSHTKRLIDAGNATIIYTYLDELETERGSQNDVVMLYCHLDNETIHNIIMPTIYDTGGMILKECNTN